MAYTTINKSTDYFNTKLYTGDGNQQNVTGVGFQPDWTWVKQRGAATDHSMQDAVRGVGKQLQSNDTSAETSNNNSLVGFVSDGFTVGFGTGDADAKVNASGGTYASWNWKANGAGSANTDGSITTTVSANTTAGFSIVKFTGNGSTSATMGHGLGAIPKIIFQKRLDSSSAGDWQVSFKDVGRGYLNWNNALQLNNASSGNISYDANTTAYYKYGTTSDVSAVNVNGASYIAYCFADVQGYSKFGSYAGNGNADGTFVYTGFKPSFVMIKGTYGDWWSMSDNKRDIDNVVDKTLYANVSDAEYSGANYYIDFLSNGFKIRTAHGGMNTSTNTYIYMAFAEAPLVGTNNVPCTAR